MIEETPELKEFDMILMRKDGPVLVDPIGTLIEWFQWGLNTQSPEFVHVGIVLRINEKLVLFDTNPPASRFRNLEEIDWDTSVVLRMNEEKYPVLDKDRSYARIWCSFQTGKPYDYFSIVMFAFLALYGYMGRPFRKNIKRILSHKNSAAGGKSNICSQLVDIFYNEILGIDILPHIGKENALPGDLTSSVAHYLAHGKLGKL